MDSNTLIDLALQSLAQVPEKTLRILAGRLRLDGRSGDARLVLDELERRLGPSGVIEDSRATILEQEGRVDEARTLREQRCVTYPDANAWINLFHHVHAFGTGANDPRLADIDRELGQQPTSDIGLEMVRCEVALARGRLDEAIANATILFDESKRSSRPGLFLARMALQKGDLVTARRYLRHVNQTFGTRAAQADLMLVREVAGAEAPPDILQLLTMMTRPSPSDEGPLVSQLRAVFERVVDDSEPVTTIEAEPDPTVSNPQVLAILQDVFGYDELRPGQAEVINNVLAGTDCLAIMPTGAGKSLTFQIPAMLLDGPVVVVSPLIALMQDQLEGLPPELRKQATFINSTLDSVEMDRRREAIRSGEVRLIYAAPERLRQSEFLDLLRSVGIGLMAIDEAHCVSMWGHDFRPDYYFLTRALEELGDPPVLAITATATPAMEKQIADALQRPLQTVRTSSFRENLHYSVERHASQQTKANRLIELCRVEKGSAIVYVP
ncbi:MAG TPA: DEAD/DEAH box helicase, partial [Thermomicrobiales bacterium]|nr:DEAD/DEAH box helicase [Thermomicrobiales bacterium]